MTTLDARFRVMGTDAHVIVVGNPEPHSTRVPPTAELEQHARAFLDSLEHRWSRFLPDSELNRLNAAAGSPVVVSAMTFELVTRAVAAWHATDGAFDPTVLAAVVGAGYDRDFAAVVDQPGPTQEAVPAPGCAGIRLDPVVHAITLPAGVGLDLGGIGKGFAADLLTAELLGLGAIGVCVNLGGDLRVAGTPPSLPDDRSAGVPHPDSWRVEVDTGPDLPHPVLGLSEGAVTTSTRTRRAWSQSGEPRHHLIDPRTGRSALTQWRSATVVTGTAIDGEVLAKSAFLASSVEEADARLRAVGAAGLLVDDDGRIHQLAGIDAFLR